MAVLKTLMAAAALLAISVQAETPLCLDSERGGSLYDQAQFIQVADGRTLSVCYDTVPGANIDQNWVNDIGAILQRRVNGGACCIDCSTAAAEGCTGASKITNIDNCNIGDKPTGIDQFTKDAFMDLIQTLADRAQQIPALDDLAHFPPKLMIQKDSFLEQEFNIFGNGDTC